MFPCEGDWKSGSEEGFVHPWWGNSCNLKVEHWQHPEHHTWSWGLSYFEESRISTLSIIFFRTMCWRDWKWALSHLLLQILEQKTASSKQTWRQIKPLWPLTRFALEQWVTFKIPNVDVNRSEKSHIPGSESRRPPGEHLCCCRPCWLAGWAAGDFLTLVWIPTSWGARYL